MTYQLSPETIAACQEVFTKKRTKVLKIAEAVSEATGIPVQHIMSNRLDAATARARQIVMYEARLAGMSYPQIGAAMGKHHTSIIHGVRTEQARRGK